MHRVAGWSLYLLVWATAGAVWSAVAAVSAHVPVVTALPYGIAAMTMAGLLGIGVWSLTSRIPWAPRVLRFGAVHGAGMLVYSAAYATSAVWVDVLGGRGLRGLGQILASPTFVWNLLFGVGLYVAVAGVAYAIRSQREAASARVAALRAETLLSEARLAALRARVNPHFLFNALHSVGTLVSVDPRAAEQAIERLGDLLRYALNTREIVPFRDEWQFTQDYLRIEALRLGYRLRTVERVDADAFAVPVPALVLQPLVENAIRHGVADRADGGTLSVSASVEGGALRLCVTDDGGGESMAAGHGTGLATLAERLRGHYGVAASLDARATPSGFSVHVTVPILADGLDEDER